MENETKRGRRERTEKKKNQENDEKNIDVGKDRKSIKNNKKYEKKIHTHDEKQGRGQKKKKYKVGEKNP